MEGNQVEVADYPGPLTPAFQLTGCNLVLSQIKLILSTHSLGVIFFKSILMYHLPITSKWHLLNKIE